MAPDDNSPNTGGRGKAQSLNREAHSYYSFAHIGWQRDGGTYGRIAGFRRGAEIL